MSATFSGIGETAVSISSTSATLQNDNIIHKMIVIIIAAILFVIIVATFDIIRYFYYYSFAIKISDNKDITDSARIQLLSTTFFAITALMIGLVLIPAFVYLASKKC